MYISVLQYLCQYVGAVSVERVDQVIEGVDVRAALDGAGARAVLLHALPQTPLTNTVSVGDSSRSGVRITFKTQTHTRTHTLLSGMFPHHVEQGREKEDPDAYTSPLFLHEHSDTGTQPFLLMSS